MLTAPTLEMLAFIRYMYNLAMEQSRQPEPIGTVSLLTFHDSVELFLDLACDQFDVPSKKTMEFKDYWSALETAFARAKPFSKEIYGTSKCGKG